MSITKILTDKDLAADKKLEQVAEVVAGVRETYGNSDVEIKDRKVNTTHGALPFSQLEDDSKVEILTNEALNIKARAIADVEENSAVVLKRRVEELLATNAFFANVSAGTDFEYL